MVRRKMHTVLLTSKSIVKSVAKLVAMTLEAQQTTTRAVEILDIAERLIQTRGFNAFSYSDIAKELGVTTPALHYHYRSKELLGEALILRYSERFFRELEAIKEAIPDAAGRLTQYANQYRMLLSDNRMCLCGILAAEYQTLPPSMQTAVLEFFRRNESWLEGVLREGVLRGEISASEPLAGTAQLIIDTLEGAMMIARAHDEPERFERASSQLLHSIAS